MEPRPGLGCACPRASEPLRARARARPLSHAPRLTHTRTPAQVNGFTIAYRYTRDPRYLAQATAAADCFIRLLTACCGNDVYNWAPLWDFNVTGADIRVDTSAMFIAAEGILELSWYTSGAEQARYYGFAKQLLQAGEAGWLFDARDNDAVLRNGTVTFPLAGVSIVYGDYYLLATRLKFDATPVPPWQ